MFRQSWLPKGFEFLSGFPERIRRKRLILTLQAIFDDSGSKGQDRFMVMAGLLGTAELFGSLATQWDKHLRARHPGKIDYFKLDEAVVLDGQFRHWQEHKRDEKIRQMAKVVDRDDLFEIGIALDLHAYQKVFGPWKTVDGGRHGLRHPYLLLCEFVLSECVTEAVKRGSTKPLEIVYDEHRKYRLMFTDAYKHFLEVEQTAPERLAVMPFQPWFRDDQDFVMLQAADMLAGELRLSPVDDKPAPLQEILCPKLKASGFFHVIVESDMRDLDMFVRAHRELKDG